MTEERLALSELLEKAGEGDFLRAVAEAVLQLLMEADVEGLIGAARYERSGERTTWRNGHRDRVLDTRLGSLQLRIPKLRQGSYFPPFLEARKVSEKALVAVIQEAWIGGVSTRRVDELVQAMGEGGQGSACEAGGMPPEGCRASASRGSPSCARISMSGCMRSWIAHSPANGRICGSTRPT
jgi:putative transposase